MMDHRDQAKQAAQDDQDDQPDQAEQADQGEDAMGDMELYDLRVTVDRIEGRSVCGMAVGDCVEVTHSAHLRIPGEGHFCVYALASVLPFLAAKQRQMPEGDWLEQDTLFACPDPEERLIMRVDRIGRRRMRSQDLT